MAHAAAADWSLAAQSCVEQLGDVDAANLGFVYVTDPLVASLPNMVEFLREKTDVEDWVGTVGIGICATGREYFDEPALAVMVGDLPTDAFRVFPAIKDSLVEFRSANRAWVDSAQPAFGIVHADPRNPETPNLVADLSNETASFLVGGLSSSRAGYDQVAGKVVEGGLSGVLFSENVAIATELTQGCSPIGPIRTVTSGQEHVIFELEARPALDVFKEDIGAESDEDLVRKASNMHIALPIAGSDTGVYLVRNLIGIDPDRGWLAIGEQVSAGDRLMFCRRDATSAREDLGRMLQDLKARADKVPRGAVYYSCVARGPNLFGENSEELEQIRQVLGDVPLVRFFCNGEISHNRLYAYTGVLALFL